MITAAAASSFLVLRIRPTGSSSLLVRVALDVRGDGDAGLEARESQRQLGEDQERHRRPSPAGCRSPGSAAAVQWLMTAGFSATCQSEAPMTTRLRTR